ncbi:hypothetical protein [Absicoccus porci]|uniref:hypothetical protein n=1 Tax=Absicoccus porci TaxID=2486576 RepID=UPI00294358E8|nr:hypothetical protein [Absicoccus porci]MEE1354878.1 hypothetical protein [Absicoccus porci]
MRFVFWIVFIIVIVDIFLAQLVKKSKISIKPKKDVTCETQYNHDHDKQSERYIVHDEPEQGYVILNGVKRRIEDCKDL